MTLDLNKAEQYANNIYNTTVLIENFCNNNEYIEEICNIKPAISLIRNQSDQLYTDILSELYENI